MTSYIGRSIPRVEDLRFITGRGCYSDDVFLEGQAYCAFVRSPHAHARIAGIEIAAAAESPGVFAVLTGADSTADGLLGMAHLPNPADALDVSLRAFTASPTVRSSRARLSAIRTRQADCTR